MYQQPRSAGPHGHTYRCCFGGEPGRSSEEHLRRDCWKRESCSNRRRSGTVQALRECGILLIDVGGARETDLISDI